MGILEPLRLLAWPSGDGKDLVIASPNYTQVPQYSFEERFSRSSVKRISRRRSTQDRYKTYEVSGSGRPAGTPLPSFEPAFAGQKRPKFISRNRIGIAQDTTGDFQVDKRLFIVSEAMSQGEAQELAERVRGQGLVHAEQIRVTVPGHGQTRPGTSVRTLYTFDTLAHVVRTIEAVPGNEREEVLIDADYYVQRVNFTSDRDGGEVTELSLGLVGVPLS